MKAVYRTITLPILIFAVLLILASCGIIPSGTETTSTSEESTAEAAGFITNARKYDYNENNVAVLNVENKSDSAYTINIKLYYKDSQGNNIGTDNATFEGFPPGYSNNFFFEPGKKFSSFSYDITAVKCKNKSIADSIEVENARLTVDKLPKSTFSSTPNSSNIYHVTIMAGFDTKNISNTSLLYYYECAVINRRGEMYLLDNNRKCTIIDPLSTKGELRIVDFTDILWEDADSFEFPSELEGADVLVSIKSVEVCPAYW